MKRKLWKGERVIIFSSLLNETTEYQLEEEDKVEGGVDMGCD